MASSIAKLNNLPFKPPNYIDMKRVADILDIASVIFLALTILASILALAGAFIGFKIAATGGFMGLAIAFGFIASLYYACGTSKCIYLSEKYLDIDVYMGVGLGYIALVIGTILILWGLQTEY